MSKARRIEEATHRQRTRLAVCTELSLCARLSFTSFCGETSNSESDSVDGCSRFTSVLTGADAIEAAESERLRWADMRRVATPSPRVCETWRLRVWRRQQAGTCPSAAGREQVYAAILHFWRTEFSNTIHLSLFRLPVRLTESLGEEKRIGVFAGDFGNAVRRGVRGAAGMGNEQQKASPYLTSASLERAWRGLDGASFDRQLRAARKVVDVALSPEELEAAVQAFRHLSTASAL